MRWIKKKKTYPKEYETREKWIFPIFPETINGDTRWLWFYKVEQIYYFGTGAIWKDCKYDFLGSWHNKRWIN